MKLNRYLTAFLSLAIMTAFIAPNLALIGQKRNSTAVASSKAPAAAKCSGAWTGLVSYTRTQSQTENKRVERVSGRGQDTRKWEMRYNYRARVAVVEAPAQD